MWLILLSNVPECVCAVVHLGHGAVTHEHRIFSYFLVVRALVDEKGSAPRPTWRGEHSSPGSLPTNGSDDSICAPSFSSVKLVGVSADYLSKIGS